MQAAHLIRCEHRLPSLNLSISAAADQRRASVCGPLIVGCHIGEPGGTGLTWLFFTLTSFAVNAYGFFDTLECFCIKLTEKNLKQSDIPL